MDVPEAVRAAVAPVFAHGEGRAEFAGEAVLALLERDILAGTSGDPNILRLLPPLTLGEAEVDRLARALKEISA